MHITRGKIEQTQRVVIYGPHGIGKSTLAAQFPNPVFIDIEDGTGHLDCARAPQPTSWQMLLDTVKDAGSSEFQTVIIDTADWAESLCEGHICAKHQKAGIEDFGYGKGFVYAYEEFGRFLNLLTEVRNSGKNVVLLSHSQMRKFELPEQNGGFDRWEMKLSKRNTPLVQEWADAVLFASYDVITVKDENKKTKAKGGLRVIRTSFNPVWDAKNRWGLADQVPMEFAQIAAHIPTLSTSTPVVVTTTTKPEKVVTVVEESPEPVTCTFAPDEGFPTALYDLMQRDGITEGQVRKAIAARGIYPEETPIENYPEDFVARVVSSWDGMRKFIAENNIN